MRHSDKQPGTPKLPAGEASGDLYSKHRPWYRVSATTLIVTLLVVMIVTPFALYFGWQLYNKRLLTKASSDIAVADTCHEQKREYDMATITTPSRVKASFSCAITSKNAYEQIRAQLKTNGYVAVKEPVQVPVDPAPNEETHYPYHILRYESRDYELTYSFQPEGRMEYRDRQEFDDSVVKNIEVWLIKRGD